MSSSPNDPNVATDDVADPVWQRGWEAGFSSGQSDIESDYWLALDEQMPDGVNPTPVNVSTWVDGLEHEIVLLRAAVRQMFEAAAKAGQKTLMLTGTEDEIVELRAAVDRALVAHPDDAPAPPEVHIVECDGNGSYATSHPQWCQDRGDSYLQMCAVQQDVDAHYNGTRPPMAAGRFVAIHDVLDGVVDYCLVEQA